MNFRNLTLTLAALIAFAFGGFAQNATCGAANCLTTTTLSADIADSSGQVMTVASATGFTVTPFTVAYIDSELVGVSAVNTTTIRIIRGYGGTARAHKSGSLVWVGTPNLFFATQILNPQGKCVRGNEQVLPVINVNTSVISDCINGTWVQGDRTTAPPFRVESPKPGGTAYTSINTSGTTLGATTLYCTEVNLVSNKYLTGIAVLNGTTVGTDKQYVVLYDSGGAAVANSALAGATTSGASTYQARAFVTPYYAVGPAQYFACVQNNGTTDSLRMAVTGTNDNLLTKGQTAATFGTIPALTVPTTFTTAVGPYIYLY